jgi:hypothetical protein
MSGSVPSIRHDHNLLQAGASSDGVEAGASDRLLDGRAEGGKGWPVRGPRAYGIAELIVPE